MHTLLKLAFCCMISLFQTENSTTGLQTTF